VDWKDTIFPHKCAPIAVIDIGSNSIRLVIYEAALRSPAPLFNEKILCGLGRKLATTGRLNDRAMERALLALRRFYKISKHIGVKTYITVATEAVRRAENGREFIERAEQFAEGNIRIISGVEEAALAAAGIAAGFIDPDGFAGDLGGGSLELIDLKGAEVLDETSVPLGSLNLIDLFGADMGKASTHIDQHLRTIPWLERGRGRPFFAIGGTWRSVARLHMLETGYPLSIVQHYTMTTRQIDMLYAAVIGRAAKTEGLEKISSDRRDMLPYGLLVLKRLVDRMQPSRIVFSAFGVREGLIYQLLSHDELTRDPLIAACEEMASRRARSPEYGNELFKWTDGLFEVPDVTESAQERRLRHAACLLCDVGWRGHPDYRGEKVLGLIAQSSFVGIDHPERAFLALAVYYIHQTSLTGDFSPALRELIGRKWNKLAKIIACAARVASKLSASMSGVLSKTTLGYQDGKLVLHLPSKLEALDGEALRRRFKALAQIMNCDPEIRIEPKGCLKRSIRI
jgi:exopolyphosphatase / guanosine-5'-triphosphate,3'-diphosphate pyrophosphatase